MFGKKDEEEEKQYYGFNKQYNGIFKDLKEELSEVMDVSEPEIMQAKERRELRLMSEEGEFEGEQYISDFICNEEIKAIINSNCWWCHIPLLKGQSEKKPLIQVVGDTCLPFSSFQQPNQIEFSETERQQLMELKNKDCLLVFLLSFLILLSLKKKKRHHSQ